MARETMIFARQIEDFELGSCWQDNFGDAPLGFNYEVLSVDRLDRKIRVRQFGKSTTDDYLICRCLGDRRLTQAEINDARLSKWIRRKLVLSSAR